MEFKEDLRKHYNIELSSKQENMFEVYYETMIDYNKHTNLTTITERKDAYYKHFYDSLTLSPFIKGNESLCDMGSGAGFPSLPLKIVFPNLKVTIIDSSMKRIKFLEIIVDKLELKNVELIHSRVEDYAISNQKKFDLVTARALGNMRIITELGVPMLKVGGQFLAMKGSKGEEELSEALPTINHLNTKVLQIHNLKLPYDYGARMIIILEKEKHISGYPRRYQDILKKPIG